MLLGAIADDFTGASDLANTLTRAGMATTLFVGVPKRPVAPCEAGVVALKSRSIPAAEAVARSLDALDWIEGQGARQVLFKYCSTFDSTPEGNIGPVADALLARLGGVAVVCPAFPGAGRTIYAGHLFVNGVPLHESGMQNHPLNPMTDPDLRRWLARQAATRVAWVSWEEVSRGRAAIRARLAEIEAEGPALVVVDALTDENLIELGAALDGAALITGGSGVALGLPDNFRRAGRLGAPGAGGTAITGPGVVLSGSCSTASRAQAEDYAASHPARHVTADEVMSGAVSADALADWAAAQEVAPLISTSASPEAVAAAQKTYGREALSAAIEALTGDLAAALVDRGIRRIAVGGGETSGAVIEALGLEEIRIGAEIAPGVPLVYSEAGGRPLALALKSGNFGGDGFYRRALDMMEAP